MMILFGLERKINSGLRIRQNNGRLFEKVLVGVNGYTKNIAFILLSYVQKGFFLKLNNYFSSLKLRI
jgi:hypothetical protein